MTTALLPPESTAVPAGPAPRMLAISANLLPPEIIAVRRARKVRRLVLVSLGIFTAALAAWYGLATVQTGLARDELARAEREVLQLQNQQRNFTELVAVQAESTAIAKQLSELTASDLQWSQLLASLQQTAPEGVRLTSVTGTLAAKGDAQAAGGQLPRTSGEKVVGSLTVAGTAPSKELVARYVDALGKVPGLANPLLGDVTTQGSRVQFSVRLDITQTALGGRHSQQKAGK
jgi:Tfp pilus assembly protein PilN